MARFLARIVGSALLAHVVAIPSLARGADDEPLPAPKPQPREFVMPGTVSPFPLYNRRSSYDVWQYYAVDRTGHFRPRVIYAPYGVAYYLETGQPFPWAETRSLEWMPYVVEH
jgi:hypothetical protein